MAKLKSIPTTEAVGHVLCHDITQIIKGVSKGPRFKKGHIVKEEDIPVLLSIGKDNLYIYENDGSYMHENDGAMVLCDLCKNEYMTTSDIKEGKVELRSTVSGVLKIDTEKLFQVNSFGELMIATRNNHAVVNPGDVLAGMRIIPLLIENEKMERLQKEVKGPILEIKPFQKKKVAIFTTGNEVFYGRIKDTFTPVVINKVTEFGAEIVHTECVGDNNEILTQKILEQIENGADFILCTGGMSVDPDDKTPLSIKNTGADIVSYGSPVLPGAMLMIAYKGNVPIVGLPGCVMYAKRTVFDLVLPRFMADDRITKDELARLGNGGLCLNCDVCTYPKCGFGKGW
ncbi:MAG: molybdopterin-binding protein [Firmicutes bacterium]|nr:molybdopterin-binding protein [Bacillota bacterium]